MPIKLRNSLLVIAVLVVCLSLVGHDLYPKWIRDRLADAVRRSDVVGVRSALARGADPNAVIALWAGEGISRRRSMLTLVTQSNHTEYLRGASRADARDNEIIRILLKAGAKIDARDPEGRPPLFCAVLSHREDLVKTLLEAGADVHARTAEGETALSLATRQNLKPMIQLLKQAGAGR